MIRPVAKIVGAIVVILLALALAAGGAVWYVSHQVEKGLTGPDPVSIATASLASIREQNRLTPFAARYVAVITSTQSRFGLSARRTLIMPGNVRYEVDLGRLRQRDVTWDAATSTLTVTLPQVELAGPDVDLTAMRAYDDGGMLLRLTDASDRLDAANRAAGQRELLKQARAPTAVRLARDAARRAVERSFALPLRAAGLNANVHVRFADEAEVEPMDHSRSLADVYANQS
jgi:hypothetical protein